MAEKTTEELLELIEKSGKAEEVFKKLKEGADETVKGPAALLNCVSILAMN